MSNKARRMLVLLLIILKEAGPTAACSSSCSSVCDCRNMGLTSVPQDLPTDITQLDLEPGNAITTLNQSDFSRYRSLTTLNLGTNQISMIHNNTFQDLNSLNLLNLRKNKLSNLLAGTFVGLGNLETLYLDYNQLTTLPAGIFEGLGNLQFLAPTYNRLSSLPADVFVGLGNLPYLNLERNQLTNLPAGIFEGLGKLQTLLLRNNHLTTLPAGIFMGLGNLQTLWLEGNQLTSLPAGIFVGLDNLGSLALHSNPWQCDCRMAPSRQRMIGSYPFEDLITCAGPANLQGQILQDVNFEELNCEETTPVYSTSSTKHMVDSTDPPFASTVTETNSTGPADGGIVLSVPLLATLCIFLGLFIICTIGFAVWCMYKRRQRDPTPQQGFSNTNPTGTSSGHDQIGLQAVTTNAGINSQSGTPHLGREDSQHIYNLPTDEDPDTAEYNTIDEVNRQNLDSFGYLVLPPSLPPRPGNQTGPQAASHIKSADAAARTTSVIGPSQRSGSGQIQHLGSFNDGYEVPSPSLYTGEGPQSHKYVNSQVAAAAKDAAAGPKVIMYENDDEIESAKEGPQSHKYVNSHVAAAAKDAAAGPQDVVYDNENEIESAKEGPQSHKYVNSQTAAAAKDAAAGPQLMVYENEDEVEPAKGTK